MTNDDARGSRRRAPRSTKGGGLPTAARNEQANLFGAEPGAAHVGPVARKTDPKTSHTAARTAARGITEKQLAVLDTFQRGREQNDESVYDMTYEQLVDVYTARRAMRPACGWYPLLTESSIRTRAKELRDLGYVLHVDDEGRTRTGGECARWRATPQGFALNIETERFKRAAITRDGSR